MAQQLKDKKRKRGTWIAIGFTLFIAGSILIFVLMGYVSQQQLKKSLDEKYKDIQLSAALIPISKAWSDQDVTGSGQNTWTYVYRADGDRSVVFADVRSSIQAAGYIVVTEHPNYAIEAINDAEEVRAQVRFNPFSYNYNDEPQPLETVEISILRGKRYPGE